MAGVEILALWLGVSFFFIILGYASKNKVFEFAGGSAMLILSLLLLGFGYDVPTGVSTITNYTTVGDNVTEFNYQTNTYTNVSDNYSYAIGTLLLIISCYIMFMLGTGRL